MPVLLGVIFGVFLTVAGALAYDTTTGRVANGLSVSLWLDTHRWSIGTWSETTGTACKRTCVMLGRTSTKDGSD